MSSKRTALENILFNQGGSLNGSHYNSNFGDPLNRSYSSAYNYKILVIKNYR